MLATITCRSPRSCRLPLPPRRRHSVFFGAPKSLRSPLAPSPCDVVLSQAPSPASRRDSPLETLGAFQKPPPREPPLESVPNPLRGVPHVASTRPHHLRLLPPQREPPGAFPPASTACCPSLSCWPCPGLSLPSAI